MIACRRGGWSIAAALLFTPVAAHAQGCSDLRTDAFYADRQGRSLTKENPGIAVIALGCLATAAQNYEDTKDQVNATGTFAVCGGVGCNLVTGGYQNCISVGSQIVGWAIRLIADQEMARRQGCEL